MKTRRIVIVIPLVLLALALVLSSNLLLRLFFLSLLVLVAGYFWTLFGARGLRVKFGELPEHSQVGDQFDRDIAVSNDSRLPKLLLRLEEKTDFPGYHNLKALNLRPKSAVAWQNSVPCRRRGRYHLGQATITAGDPLGFFSVSRQFGEPEYTLVYPATLELPFFQVSVTSAIGSESGGWLVGRAGPNVSSVREFAHGDSLTHIHWPTTARTGRLMVKVFEEDRSPSISDSICLIVDMQQAAQLGHDDDSTEEYAVTIAASLLKKYLNNGLKVGLVASSDPPCVFAPDRGEEHLNRMLEALAVVRANGNTPIDRAIADGMKHAGAESTAIIISPTATPRLADAVRRLKMRGNLVGVVWLEPISFGGATNSPGIARSLSLLGIQTYIVRKGDELTMALDSRATPASLRFS